MSDAIDSLVLSIRSDLKQLEVIGHNIANSTTPGFKAIQASSQFQVLLGAPAPGNELLSSQLSQQQGALKETDSKSQLALVGEGYFLVEHQSTLQKNLVRTLNLSTDSQGNLRHNQDYYVLGQAGAIYSDINTLSISDKGVISSDDKVFGQLEVVAVIDPSLVQMNVSGQLKYSQENTRSATDFKVKQGFVEQSNVNSSQEIIKMMHLSKHLESNQKVMMVLDQFLDTGINKLGGN